MTTRYKMHPDPGGVCACVIMVGNMMMTIVIGKMTMTMTVSEVFMMIKWLSCPDDS